MDVIVIINSNHAYNIEKCNKESNAIALNILFRLTLSCENYRAF